MERFRAAFGNGAVDRPPVWMMRQAGRALPEYRALKERHSFWEMCRSPELAAEATLQPVRRFPLDAAILFSDILVVPDAMGIEVAYTPAPVLSPLVASASDVAALRRPDVGVELCYVERAIRAVCDQAGPDLAVIGFSGAPYTLACYMVDGTGSKGFVRTRAMMYSDPGLFEGLLSRLADVVGDYVEMQAEASVAAVQLFDTWAGDLPEGEFRRFALPYAWRVLERLVRRGVPAIYYVNGVSAVLEAAASSGCAALGVDWRISLAEVRRRLGPRQVVQGNLDPAVLFGGHAAVRARVYEMLDATGGTGHIVNLGHGLLPDTPLEGMASFLDSVREWAEERDGSRPA